MAWGALLVDGHRRGAFAGHDAPDGLAHVVGGIVELERRLDGEGLRARIFGEGAVDVDGAEVAPEGNGADADDGVERDAGLLLEAVEAREGDLEHQFGGDRAVIERGVAAREEHALVVGLLRIAQEVADDGVAVRQVLHILDEGDDAHLLGVELADPVADGASVAQGAALLADDESAVVGVDVGEFVGGGGEGEDDLADGRLDAAGVELGGDVPRLGDALERLDERLAHLELDARIGDAHREAAVGAEALALLEEVGVVGEQFLDDLVVRLLPLRVPHLLVAAQGEEFDRLPHLAVAPQHAVRGVGGHEGVVRVLRAHALGDGGHRGALPRFGGCALHHTPCGGRAALRSP